jgi:hypothetical protein
MYWMSAEGLADDPTAGALSSFLAVPADTLGPYLERCVADGYLKPAGAGYSLTESGEQAGKRGFADEFAELTKPGHGECDADCWCHDSLEAAAECSGSKVASHAHN